MDLSFVDSFGDIVNSTLNLGIKIIAGILGMILLGILFWFYQQKKNLNIPVTIWIPRSDGKIIDEVNAKGGFFKMKQSDGGFISSFKLKRKKQSAIDIPPPASRFLVGLSRKLYLIQKGIDDFEPVLPDSFRYVRTQKGNKIAIIDLNCINQDATAWVEDYRENAKRRFTLHGFWEKYKDFIQITIFIFIVMLALYMNWTGLKDVVEGLQNVADSLATHTAPSISIN